MYSKLYSVPPGHDRELLDKYIPYYLKPHFEKTAYTSKVRRSATKDVDAAGSI